MAKAADRIKRLIENAKARGLKKSKIAEAMGISRQHLSNLLTGKNDWKLGQLEALSEILDVSLAEVFLEMGEDVEVFVLLKKILDAGPESAYAIMFNIEAIADKIMNSGTKLRTKPKAKVAGIKTTPRTTRRARFYLPPGMDIGPKLNSVIGCFSAVLGSLL